MQNDAFGCYDEVEPRSMPKPASKFHSRPFPMVPEVSLIMDKPPKSKRADNSLSHTVPELKSTNPSDVNNKQSETYAAWKEKQFPMQTNRAPPNRMNQVYSPVPHTGSLQDLHGSRQSLRSYNSVDGDDYQYKSQGNESPRKYGNTRSNGQFDNPNKYTLSYARNVSTNDHMNSYNRASRSHSSDETGSPSVRRRSSHSREREIYDSRQNSSPLSRRKGERCHETESYNTRHRSSSSDRRRHDHLQEQENYEHGHKNISNGDRKRSDFSRAIEAYDIRQKTNSYDRRQVDQPREVESFDRQKSKLHRSSSYSSADIYSHRSLPTESSSKHSRSLQAVKYSPERTHHYSGCCTSNHSNSNSETETVKNLLQVITSQNEQIKNLQKQVERLLKLHEQSLKDKNQCTCQSNGIVYQNAQMYDQCQTTNLPFGSNNLMKDNERCFPELKMQDEKNKQTIVEQKVSIGVMTSFELKVQNNPSVLSSDNELRQKNNGDKILPSLETKNMIKNLVNDTGEMIRKKQHFFQPTALENISEGSESHMSSLRQSHLCPDSTRQSIEAHDSLEVRNSNFARQSCQESNNVHQIKESTQSHNRSADNRAKRPTNLEYERREPPYGRDTAQDQLVYQYNLPYDHLRSSPDVAANQKKADEFNTEPLMTDITKVKSTKCDNFADDCLSLSSSELDVEDPSPPSPEPSIHLDMQEYSESGSLPPQKAQKVGWTLYNNVLDQVNQILQNTPMNDGPEEESMNGARTNGRKEYDNNIIMDTVKAATLEQLTKLGISFSENIDQRETNYNKRVMFDASYFARQGPETHIATTSGGIETNTSMHMKALARKYLNEEQLADMAIQKSRIGGLKSGSNNVQNSNMSFATMHYLQRYHLLPGGNSAPAREAIRENCQGLPTPVINERMELKAAERRDLSPRKFPAFAGNSKVSCPSKILDISTLKQQPKLL